MEVRPNSHHSTGTRQRRWERTAARQRPRCSCDKDRTVPVYSPDDKMKQTVTGWSGLRKKNREREEDEMPPLLLLPTACCAAVAAAAPPWASGAFSRPPPSRLRASHLPFAFRRLRKYGRRDREPVASTSFDEEESDDEDEDDDDDMEEPVDEDIFLKNRPKPAGFGVGKTYTTDIEERLLREMGLGGSGRKSEPAPAKHLRTTDSAKETGGDSTDGIHVRIWNLPKKKNIHKDLNLAFKRFPGLITINPANSANKKTRDPVCKGFAFLTMESLEAATRFVELYSCKSVLFGKVEKPIKCCIVDRHSSTATSNKPSNTQAAGSTLQRLVAVR